MRSIIFIFFVGAFLAGCLVGACCERAGLHVAENKECLTYDGSVYVRAIQGTTLEDYLTAAGKPKPTGKK